MRGRLWAGQVSVGPDAVEDRNVASADERGAVGERLLSRDLSYTLEPCPDARNPAMIDDPDVPVRLAAFAALERLVIAKGGRLAWRDIAGGFPFRGDLVHFANRARGIFKPRQMAAALSVKTTEPRGGRRTWYRDQASVVDADTGLVSYDLARDTASDSNNSLRAAFERRAPLIYFRAVEPAVYEAIWPVWIEKFSTTEGRVFLAAEDSVGANVSSVQALSAGDAESRPRSYYLVESRHRNHQAWFSSRTKSAYGYRCAFSGLPLRDLLVGAHIVPDADDGPASVANGICMSTLHHTAFDTHLIGVDPDLRIHVAESVFAGRDGPLLESLKALADRNLRVPGEVPLQPRREYLEQRFAQFVVAQP